MKFYTQRTSGVLVGGGGGGPTYKKKIRCVHTLTILQWWFGLLAGFRNRFVMHGRDLLPSSSNVDIQPVLVWYAIFGVLFVRRRRVWRCRLFVDVIELVPFVNFAAVSLCTREHSGEHGEAVSTVRRWVGYLHQICASSTEWISDGCCIWFSTVFGRPGLGE